MSVIRIQKNPNRKVRVTETGEELADKKVYAFEDSVHWRRRIQSGDVIEVSDKEDDAAQKKTQEKEPEAEGDSDTAHDAPKPRGRPKSK